MSIPEECTVLVVGGGPAGSFTAAVLARENINTVVLEAEIFPRYHIGESMLPSFRHFLRFIDLDSTFDNYGFVKKVGAAFKLDKQKREGYTDFLAAGGPEGYAWNVIRSEADNLLFQHAGISGAKIFDGIKVDAIHFTLTDPTNKVSDCESNSGDSVAPFERPISASYTRKSDGLSGTIKFDYIVDASGRTGLLNTKYLKDRIYNQGLKNIAHWGYWEHASKYAPGTARANSPFFEALLDETGWAWFIPLHNNTTSVGIVLNRELARQRKATWESPSTEAFYLSCLELAPNVLHFLRSGKLTTEIKSASDYSYSSSLYALPHARIVGDAGCFIDPYFSSGVHLALTGGLSAAATICASIRGHQSEETAWKWHSAKVAVSYTRFLLVVLSAYKQIRNQEKPILSDFNEDNFDRAFAFFRPSRLVIQGTVDVNSKLSQAELLKTVDFCATAFEPKPIGEHNDTALKSEVAGFQKMNGSSSIDNVGRSAPASTAVDENLSTEEIYEMKQTYARQMMRMEDGMNLGGFSTDIIDGLVLNLTRGNLGLIRPVSQHG